MKTLQRIHIVGIYGTGKFDEKEEVGDLEYAEDKSPRYDTSKRVPKL